MRRIRRQLDELARDNDRMEREMHRELERNREWQRNVAQQQRQNHDQ